MTITFKAVAGGALIAAMLASYPAAAQSTWWKPWSKSDASNSTAAPTPPQTVGDSGYGAQPVGGAVDAAGRMDRIEAQMRTLTGQIEQLGYQLKQLQDQLARMQADNEFRLSALEGGKPAPRPPAAAAPGQSSSAAPVVPPRPPAMPAASAAPAPASAAPQMAAAPVQPISAPAGGAGVQLGTPPQPLGQLTLDGPPAAGGQPLDLSSLARGASQTASLGPNGAPPAPVLTGDARSDYEQAYQHILAGDYDGAESSFRQFLSAYPSDANAPDAQYWLGESLFARGKYRESADAFLAGYKTYPKSAKGADTLLKLGLSLAGLGERDAACQTYAQVLKQYPQVSNALRQRVATEQASASC